MELTSSLEDYLETILIICLEKKEARITDIASFLKVSKPSVNRAVTTLREAGYVEHREYGGITLTPSGETRAAGILHCHNLIKRFLTDTLGVDEITAQDDACKMEHVISKITINKLYRYLEGQTNG